MPVPTAPGYLLWIQRTAGNAAAGRLATLNPHLEMTVRCLGAHPVFGDGTAKATVVIGPKPLNVQVRSVDATGLTVDLYGDGRKIVRLRDDARMSRRPGMHTTGPRWW